MCAKHYENPTMLSKVTAKNVGDVFFETHCIMQCTDPCKYSLRYKPNNAKNSKSWVKTADPNK